MQNVPAKSLDPGMTPAHWLPRHRVASCPSTIKNLAKHRQTAGWELLKMLTRYKTSTLDSTTTTIP